MQQREHGGTLVGFILGMVLGLGIALAVAVYVTKVPVTFVNKVMNRSAEQDASEVLKNKDWDPNAPLYGKNPAKPANSSAAEVTPSAPPLAPPPAVAGGAPATPTAPTMAPDTAQPADVAPSADPLGDLTRARAAAPAVALDPFTYYVQVGAYRTDEDAQTQRVKLSLAGFETKVTQREQSGKTVFRVRMGPFNTRDEANQAKENLQSKGFQTVMVRVQR